MSMNTKPTISCSTAPSYKSDDAHQYCDSQNRMQNPFRALFLHLLPADVLDCQVLGPDVNGLDLCRKDEVPDACTVGADELARVA